ncbi:MAG: hypothetical protein WDN07_00230 [Actinomycetota bacterium]
MIANPAVVVASNDRGNRDGNFKSRRSGGGRFESSMKSEGSEVSSERTVSERPSKSAPKKAPRMRLKSVKLLKSVALANLVRIRSLAKTGGKPFKAAKPSQAKRG